MTYRGRVQHGVIVIEGPQQPAEGAVLRIEEDATAAVVGEGLEKLAGQAQGLPSDLAERHDDHRKHRP